MLPWINRDTALPTGMLANSVMIEGSMMRLGVWHCFLGTVAEKGLGTVHANTLHKDERGSP